MYEIIWKKSQLDYLISYFEHSDFSIIHKLDDKQFDEITYSILNKISEYVSILEEEYNTNEYLTFGEVEKNLGGFILFVDDEKGTENKYTEVVEKYLINSDEVEFTEVIIAYENGERRMEWILELYCYTDFNIVIIALK